MPYIEPGRRHLLPETFFAGIDPTAGDLNYLFSLIAREYLAVKGLRYQSINDIIGALEGCKIETYRRVAADYEDAAIKRNGDVW